LFFVEKAWLYLLSAATSDNSAMYVFILGRWLVWALHKVQWVAFSVVAILSSHLRRSLLLSHHRSNREEVFVVLRTWLHFSCFPADAAE